MTSAENSPKSSDLYARFLKPDFLVPASTLIVCLAALYGFVPYATGYWGKARTIADWTYEGWTGKSGDYAHGMLVLPICALIIYLKREKIARLPMQSNQWGLPILLLGLLMFWIGVKADNAYIGYFSAHVVSAGLIVWLFGWALFKELFFPWIFILFMWPFSFLDNVVAFPLRLLMSNLAYHVLNFMGAHCSQVGTAVVSAPDYVRGIKQGEKFGVDVADPCSGIRSLFALTMFSALYAYFILPKTWQKWILFACSPALAILGNLTRIVMLSLGSLQFGAQFAIGTNDEPSWFHEAAGYAVFLVAVGGMIGIGWILERDWSFILRRPKK